MRSKHIYCLEGIVSGNPKINYVKLIIIQMHFNLNLNDS